MKIINQILRNYLGNIRTYIESEKELIKLKVVKTLSPAVANLIAVIFMIILFHITLALGGIWLGVYLGDIWENYPLGFGVSALVFIVLLLLVLVFRKPLLVRPFTNLAISSMVKEEKIIEHEDEEH